MKNISTQYNRHCSTMWVISLVLLFSFVRSEEGQDPVLYYYGLDESERSLPACAARQACAALLQRYWRAPALLRLCRCARRARCDARAPPQRTLELNNRAHFQFCKPVTDWPLCTIDDLTLTVESLYDRIDPAEIEKQHHSNIQLTPPKVLFNCSCLYPNYWKLNSTTESGDIAGYRCASPPHCRTGEFCGNVSDKLYALYQSCLCPRGDICVHGGGLPREDISEVLYRGKGWRARCTRVGPEE